LHDAYLSVSIIALPATVGLPLNTVGRTRVWWRRPARGSDGGARFVSSFDSVQAALWARRQPGWPGLTAWSRPANASPPAGRGCAGRRYRLWPLLCGGLL